MSINKEELAELSGENDTVKPSRTFYPSLRVNGNEGHLYIERIDEETEERVREKIGETTKGIFLVVTKKLFKFEKQRYFWTPEYRGRNAETVLFKSEDGNTSKIDEGMSKDLKESENLKTMYIIYMLKGDGEVVKLQVKGKGLGSLFDYFDEKENHMFEVITKIGTDKEQSQLGDYFYLTFERDSVVAEDKMEKVAEKIRKITNELDEAEEFYEEEQKEFEEEQREMAGFGEKQTPPPSSYKEDIEAEGADEEESGKPTRDDLEDPFEMM